MNVVTLSAFVQFPFVWLLVTDTGVDIFPGAVVPFAIFLSVAVYWVTFLRWSRGNHETYGWTPLAGFLLGWIPVLGVALTYPLYLKETL